MNAENFIVFGVVLILSGVFWLWEESLVVKQKAFKSITDAYKKNRSLKMQKTLGLFVGLIMFVGGIYIWGITDSDWLWTWLWIGTLSWFLKVKKSILISSLMWLGAALMNKFNFNLGLIWLLTVIGTGYFDYDKQLDKQDWLLQLAVVINPVGAMGRILSNRVNKVVQGDFKSLEVKELPNESIVNCPVCKTAMKLYKILDGEEIIVFDKCPKCNTVWFDEKDWVWAIQKSQGSKDPIIQKSSILCPRCQIKMGFVKKDGVYNCSECLGNVIRF